MPVSVMAAALREAGVKTSAEKLEEVYRGAVRQHPGNEVAARNVVVQAVERDLTLLHGLVQSYFEYRRGTCQWPHESQSDIDRPAPPPPPNGRHLTCESHANPDPVWAAALPKTSQQNTGGCQMADESQTDPDPAGQRHGPGAKQQLKAKFCVSPCPRRPIQKMEETNRNAA